MTFGADDLGRLAAAYDRKQEAHKALHEANREYDRARQANGLYHKLINANPRPSIVIDGRVYTFSPADGVSVSVTELVQ